MGTGASCRARRGISKRRRRAPTSGLPSPPCPMLRTIGRTAPGGPPALPLPLRPGEECPSDWSSVGHEALPCSVARYLRACGHVRSGAALGLPVSGYLPRESLIHRPSQSGRGGGPGGRWRPRGVRRRLPHLPGGGSSSRPRTAAAPGSTAPRGDGSAPSLARGPPPSSLAPPAGSAGHQLYPGRHMAQVCLLRDIRLPPCRSVRYHLGRHVLPRRRCGVLGPHGRPRECEQRPRAPRRAGRGRNGGCGRPGRGSPRCRLGRGARGVEGVVPREKGGEGSPRDRQGEVAAIGGGPAGLQHCIFVPDPGEL